jgi:hypothetical protein
MATELLHRICQLVFNGVGNKCPLRLLVHKANQIGQFVWLGARSVDRVEFDAPPQVASCEVWAQPVDDSKQGRFAASGWATDKNEFAGCYLEICARNYG